MDYQDLLDQVCSIVNSRPVRNDFNAPVGEGFVNQRRASVRIIELKRYSCEAWFDTPRRTPKNLIHVGFPCQKVISFQGPLISAREGGRGNLSGRFGTGFLSFRDPELAPWGAYVYQTGGSGITRNKVGT